MELCERHHNDNEHSFFVAELSREIFLRTEAIHGLDRRWLPALEAGAQLHNLGLFYGARRHHVRGMELILERGVAGFSPEEIALIALCARFHRKRVRAEEALLYRALPAELQKVALRLAAIVRVADGAGLLPRSIGAAELLR
ncbi:MAG: hypothetical protein KatS3mg115_0949 [Candidatus Poribacteria bacterium]|nr:MAG: hypothetical protein KatS3mg115_0949 [Candidatus Poribacteria bacterium]